MTAANPVTMKILCKIQAFIRWTNGKSETLPDVPIHSATVIFRDRNSLEGLHCHLLEILVASERAWG